MALKGIPSSASRSVHTIPRAVLRLLQFALALTVCGLYGTDIQNGNKHHQSADPKWLYAVVIGGISVVTSLIYGAPFVKSHLFFAWDAILFILWIAVFGVFGKMYLHENAEGNAGVQRMKNAVWVDLVNVFLWLIKKLLVNTKALKGAGKQAGAVILTADVSSPDIAIWHLIHDLSKDQ
ncbi:MAG: hypothetical protein M1840_000306 [Geoglossum simile]|nr:MAG: hypothetical protein M1840_000306 [Geoglossum simile]